MSNAPQKQKSTASQRSGAFLFVTYKVYFNTALGNEVFINIPTLRDNPTQAEIASIFTFSFSSHIF